MIARRKETMQVQELVGIVPWTFIAQICNLFIQMYLIKRFLFKPINEMLEKRRAAADAEITDAEAAKKEANAIKEEYEQNMQEAKAKANEILESARKTATLQSEKIVKEASEQAAALKTRQKKRLPRRKRKRSMKSKARSAALPWILPERSLNVRLMKRP